MPTLINEKSLFGAEYHIVGVKQYEAGGSREGNVRLEKKIYIGCASALLPIFYRV